MSSGQYQALRKQPVYRTTFSHIFTSAVALVVNASAAPGTPDKIPLSAAQSLKVLEWDGRNSLLIGNITLDDANDRILLEPGVYSVGVSIQVRDTGTASELSIALTTAAQAANDLVLDSILGGTIASGAQASVAFEFPLTVTAARALELHVWARTGAGTLSLRPGSQLVVSRLGNIDF